MNQTIAHLVHATVAAALGSAGVYYYVFDQQTAWWWMLLYTLIIPPIVVFGVNKTQIISGRKALAQTAMIALLFTLLFGIIHKLI